jgi:hypothetical protein
VDGALRRVVMMMREVVVVRGLVLDDGVLDSACLFVRCLVVHISWMFPFSFLDRPVHALSSFPSSPLPGSLSPPLTCLHSHDQNKNHQSCTKVASKTSGTHLLGWMDEIEAPGNAGVCLTADRAWVRPLGDGSETRNVGPNVDGARETLMGPTITSSNSLRYPLVAPTYSRKLSNAIIYTYFVSIVKWCVIFINAHVLRYSGFRFFLQQVTTPPLKC